MYLMTVFYRLTGGRRWCETTCILFQVHLCFGVSHKGQPPATAWQKRQVNLAGSLSLTAGMHTLGRCPKFHENNELELEEKTHNYTRVREGKGHGDRSWKYVTALKYPTKKMYFLTNIDIDFIHIHFRHVLPTQSSTFWWKPHSDIPKTLLLAEN